MKIYSRILSQAKIAPKKIAIYHHDSVITYDEFMQMVFFLANKLPSFSVVAVSLDNSPSSVALLVAASLKNITLVPFPDLAFFENHFSEIEYVFDGHNLIKVGPRTHIDAYLIVMTSGSTSAPKPIVLTQDVKLRRIYSAMKNYSLSSSDIILVSTPLNHSLAQRGVLLPLVLGGSLVLTDNFSPNYILELLDRFSVTFSFLVSSQIALIASHIDKYSLDSLKALVSTSYLLDYDVKKILRERIPIFECYGTSEIGCVTHLTPQCSKVGSVGKPLPGVKIKIQEGEILVRSPWAFTGYFNRPSETRRAFAHGFFKTGDLGEIIDGYLYYQGRKKELIKTGGISIFPNDIELVLKKVVGVKDVAVIGVRDKLLGQAIVAVVEGDFVSVQSLMETARKNLLPYQRPVYYDVVEKLPRTSLGKIKKHELQKKYESLDIGSKFRALMG